MNTSVVTGAGSGVGQAIALKLAQAGWHVALLGRRRAALEETARQAGGKAGQMLVLPCDIGSERAVSDTIRQVLDRFKNVDVLVNAAGTNTPRRAMAELALDEYHRLINTNLHGAYYCTQALLPSMRQRGAGSIINIVSEAGKQASPKAGPAYVISKFGLAGLTQSINAEERANGIRACSIFPGDIDTPILDLRACPPGPEARRKMLQAADVAECAWLVIQLPPRAVVEEILIRPR